MPSDPMAAPEPWHSFLTELEAMVNEEVRLQCLGGFVVTQRYGMPRPTADVDVLSIAPRDRSSLLLEKGGKGSKLHGKHKIYLDYVGFASLPCEYESRFVEMYPGVYRNLRLFALDPYDIALAKLGRNIPRDREDVRYLACAIPFDLQILRGRYETELRPYVIGPLERYDASFELWIEMLEEDRKAGSRR